MVGGEGRVGDYGRITMLEGGAYYITAWSNSIAPKKAGGRGKASSPCSSQRRDAAGRPNGAQALAIPQG